MDELELIKHPSGHVPLPPPKDDLDLIKQPDRPEWADPAYSPESRVQDYLRTRVAQGREWGDVAADFRQRFGSEPTPAVHQQFKLERENRLQKTGEGSGGIFEHWSKTRGGESTLEYLGRRAGPFSSALGNFARSKQYGEAVERLNKGEASDKDIAIIARFRRLEELDRQTESTFGGQLGSAAAKAPAVAGEFFLGGKVLKGIGGALGIGAAEAAPPLARAGLAIGRNAATTLAAPSMYLEHAAQKNLSEGRQADDPRGFAPAVALGMLNTAVLGRLQGRVAPGLSRIPKAGALGVGEQAGVDVLAGAVDEVLDKQWQMGTRYGVVGDLARGEIDTAMKHAAVQFLTFSAFAGMHQMGREKQLSEAFTKAADALHEQGLTPEQAGAVLSDTAQMVQAGTARRLRMRGPVGELAKAYTEVLKSGESDPIRAAEFDPSKPYAPISVSSPEDVGRLMKGTNDRLADADREYREWHAKRGNKLPDEQPVASPLDGIPPTKFRTIAANLGLTVNGERGLKARQHEPEIAAGIEREAVRLGLRPPQESPEAAPAAPEPIPPKPEIAPPEGGEAIDVYHVTDKSFEGVPEASKDGAFGPGVYVADAENSARWAGSLGQTANRKIAMKLRGRVAKTNNEQLAHQILAEAGMKAEAIPGIRDVNAHRWIVRNLSSTRPTGNRDRLVEAMKRLGVTAFEIDSAHGKELIVFDRNNLSLVPASAAPEPVAAKPSLMDRLRAGSKPALAKTAAPVGPPAGKIELPEPPGFQRPDEPRLSPVEREAVAREEPAPAASPTTEAVPDALKLNDREVKVLADRAAGRTQQQIADELGVSRQRVKQIEQAALKKQGQIESMAAVGKGERLAQMEMQGKATEHDDVQLSKTEYVAAIEWLNKRERTAEQILEKVAQFEKRQSWEKDPDVLDDIKADIILLRRILGEAGEEARPQGPGQGEAREEEPRKVQAAGPPAGREQALIAEWRALAGQPDSPERRSKQLSLIRAMKARGWQQTTETVGKEVKFDPEIHERDDMSGSNRAWGFLLQRGWKDAGGNIKVKPLVRMKALQDDLASVRAEKKKQDDFDRIRAEMTPEEREAFDERNAIENEDIESFRKPGEEPMDLGGVMFSGPGGPLFQRITRGIFHHLVGKRPGRDADFRPTPAKPDMPMDVPAYATVTRQAANQIGARNTTRHEIATTAWAYTKNLAMNIAKAWRASRFGPDPFLGDPAFHDRIEAEQKNPGSQSFTPEQRKAYEMWNRIREDLVRKMEQEGVRKFRDEATGDELDADELLKRPYMHRAVVPRSDIMQAIHNMGAKPGARAAFQKGRRYDTAAEGVQAGVRYKSFYDAVQDFIYQANRTIADQRLATDPKLGGEDLVHPKIIREMAKAKPMLDALKGTPEYDQLKQTIIRNAYESTTGNVTVAPAFRGREYSEDVKAHLERMFGTQRGRFAEAVTALSNNLRSAVLSLDLSFGQLQMQKMFFSNPIRWAHAMGRAVRSGFWDGEFQRYLKADPERVKLMNEYVEAGGNLGIRPEMAGEAASTFVEQLPVFKQAQRAMTTAIDIAKIELWQANRPNDPKQWSRAVEAIEDSLGAGRMEQLGMSPERALVERVVLLAPSYYRAHKRLMEHLFLGSGTARRIAAKQLGALASGVMLTSLAALYAAKQAGWITQDELEERLNPQRGKFLMVPLPVGGKTVEAGYGGFYINMLRTLAAAEKYAAEQGDPLQQQWRNVKVGTEVNKKGKTVDVWSKEPAVTDPIARWYKGHIGPVPRLATELATGEDLFTGRPTTKVEIAAKSLLPIGLQDVFMGEGETGQRLAKAGLGSLGLRSFPGQEKRKPVKK